MRKIGIILSGLALVLGSCGQTTKKQAEILEDTIAIQDTIAVKYRNDLTKSNQHDFISKSYSYYWLAGQDTLDFVLYVREWKRDTTLHLSVLHKNLIHFADVLKRIEACLPLIKEDFDISRLGSLYFNEPLFYLDLAKKLSNEYEQKFGQKNASYENLNQFLLNSSLTLQLDSFLNPLNKKVKRYGIEKFHLMKKEHYENHLLLNAHLSNIDFTEYPEFIICGAGVGVQLENK